MVSSRLTNCRILFQFSYNTSLNSTEMDNRVSAAGSAAVTRPNDTKPYLVIKVTSLFVSDVTGHVRHF